MEQTLSTFEIFRKPVNLITLLIITALFVATFVFYPGTLETFTGAFGNEDYSHAILIPFIIAYLVWEKRHQLDLQPASSAWPVLIVALGFLVLSFSYMANFKSLYGYGIITILWGLIWFIVGTQSVKQIAVPLALLFFMVPMPAAVHNSISYKLQLVSTDLSVEMMRWFNISVFQEGNIIDLGKVKLQVVEACSGLRYLLPLIVLAIIVVLLYKASKWRKLFIVVSAIPIAVITNSIRIAVNGLFIEYGDPALAEGFSHDFQGWLVFLAAFALLLVEVWFIENKIFKNPVSIIPSLHQEDTADTPKILSERKTKSTGIILSLGLILVMTAGLFLSRLTQLIPMEEIHRASFSSFPLQIGDWHGQKTQLEEQFLDVLKLDDYVQADFINPSGDKVNIYIPYWQDTNTDWYFHNPEVCLPGGGWTTNKSEIKTIALVDGNKANINRVEMSLGDNHMVVYYWFQMRGRILNNHLMIKPYTIVDHLKRGRSDGALVRLIQFVQNQEQIEKADENLSEFAGELMQVLPDYVPN